MNKRYRRDIHKKGTFGGHATAASGGPLRHLADDFPHVSKRFLCGIGARHDVLRDLLHCSYRSLPMWHTGGRWVWRGSRVKRAPMGKSRLPSSSSTRPCNFYFSFVLIFFQSVLLEKKKLTASECKRCKTSPQKPGQTDGCIHPANLLLSLLNALLVLLPSRFPQRRPSVPSTAIGSGLESIKSRNYCVPMAITAESQTTALGH